jgi:hypothetical protein
MFHPPGFFIALQQQPTLIHVSHVAGRLFSKTAAPIGAALAKESSHDCDQQRT